MKCGLLRYLQILGHSFWKDNTGGSEAHSTILAIHKAAPLWTVLLFSFIASNNGFTNKATTDPIPPLSASPFKYNEDNDPIASRHASLTPESESFSLLTMLPIIFVKWVAAESPCEAHTVGRSRRVSFLTAGFGSLLAS